MLSSLFANIFAFKERLRGEMPVREEHVGEMARINADGADKPPSFPPRRGAHARCPLCPGRAGGAGQAGPL